jgi:hypothetical protein
MSTLNPAFTRAWLALGGLALTVELVRPGAWAWATLFVLILGLELLAVVRNGPGDTLSEQLWAFETGWSRDLLVGAIAIWIAVRFYQLGPGADVARAALSLGLGLWLVIHWTLKGKEG